MSALLRGEDLYPGRAFELGTYTVTETEIVEFASTWDPLPFHVDREAARRGVFGGLIASGAHTFAIMVRLGSDGVMTKLDLIAGSAVRELRFSKPVRPGSVLTGHATVVDREPERNATSQVWIRFTLTDEDDDQVLSMVGGVHVRS